MLTDSLCICCAGPIVPYGLPAIRELFRFLISIMNPTDKQNNEDMSHMGIYLLTVALETAVDHLPKYASLMSLVKNELCFNLFRVGLPKVLKVDFIMRFTEYYSPKTSLNIINKQINKQSELFSLGFGVLR